MGLLNNRGPILIVSQVRTQFRLTLGFREAAGGAILSFRFTRRQDVEEVSSLSSCFFLKSIISDQRLKLNPTVNFVLFV